MPKWGSLPSHCGFSSREKTDRKHHEDDHSKFAENNLLQTEENEEKNVYDGVGHVDENEQVL